MLYKFETNSERHSELDLTERNQIFSQCKGVGLNNLHSSTIATILKQVETNLEFSKESEDTAAVDADEQKKGKKRSSSGS